MNPRSPLVYLILGTPGSGRRSLVLDLVENGLAEDEPALVLVAEGEAADPATDRLADRPRTEVRRWKWEPPDLPEQKLPAGGSVFLLADGRADPLSQIEALKPWLVRQGAELARVLCVVDCRFAEQTPALRPWYEALIHFSDVVFLTRREGVANKWLSDFIRHFEGECYPCHFIQVRKGGLPNPAIVLQPEPRRVSQYFEETEDFSGLVIETDEEDEEEDEEANEDIVPPEPYFVRNRSGRREKELPDIRAYLPAAG